VEDNLHCMSVGFLLDPMAAGASFIPLHSFSLPFVLELSEPVLFLLSFCVGFA
jgi:hypothetical protein